MRWNRAIRIVACVIGIATSAFQANSGFSPALLVTAQHQAVIHHHQAALTRFQAPAAHILFGVGLSGG
jgi:hypothetical protein